MPKTTAWTRAKKLPYAELAAPGLLVETVTVAAVTVEVPVGTGAVDLEKKMEITWSEKSAPP